MFYKKATTYEYNKFLQVKNRPKKPKSELASKLDNEVKNTGLNTVAPVSLVKKKT